MRRHVAIKLDGARGVVVARDRKGNAVRIGIAVDNGDDRYAKLAGFSDGNIFLDRVDDKDDIRQAAHILDAAESALKLVALARKLQQFLLRELAAGVDELFIQLAQSLDRLGDGLPVGEHAAEPAMVDVILAAALRGFGNLCLRLALGADEQHASMVATTSRIACSARCISGTV